MLKEYSQKFTALTPEVWEMMYSDIREFRSTFRLKIDSPMTDADCRVHQALHIEELVELALANNKAEQADAITDLVYTALGRTAQIGDASLEDSAVAHLVDMFIAAAHTLKIPFEQCWKAVHNSNMTKAATTEEVAKATVEHYGKRGIKANYVLAESGKYVISCSEDSTDETGSAVLKGKILKSINYTEVNLQEVIDTFESI